MKARSLIIVGACLALAGACGKKGSSKAQVRSGDALLELPAGTDTSAIKVTVQPQVKLPAELEKFAVQMQKHLRLVKIVSVEPASVTFATPADLTVTIAPAEMPDKAAPADIRAFVFIDGVPSDLEVERTDTSFRTHLVKPGHVMFTVGPRDATLLGTPALAARGASEILMDRECDKWLTPSSPRVAAAAKQTTIGDDKTITLPGAPAAVPYQRAGDQQHADEILEGGKADPIQQSVVYGSVLLALGHPVRLVGGDLKLERGGAKLQGFHQWAETLIDGKPWMVDTTDPAKVRLVPMAEAWKVLAIEVHRTCAAYPPGAPTDPAQWNP